MVWFTGGRMLQNSWHGICTILNNFQSLKKENIMKFTSKFLSELFAAIEAAFENSQISYDDLKNIKIDKDGDNYIAEINPDETINVICYISGGVLTSVASTSKLNVLVIDYDIDGIDEATNKVPNLSGELEKAYVYDGEVYNEITQEQEKELFDRDNFADGNS
jgi:hypothetical protein